MSALVYALTPINYLSIAESRGQTREVCESCDGDGLVRVARSNDPSDDIDMECDDCGGTGYAMGRCACSEHQWYLVPDGPKSDDGTCPGSILVCPRCAVTCYAPRCGLVSTVSDIESREQYCDEHWAAVEREWIAQIATMN